MTNEKINIKGNWMIKTLLGLTAMIFGLFLSLSVDTNRVEASGHQEILGFTGYYECVGDSRNYVTTGGGMYEECENRTDKNHGRVEFTFANKEEIDWELNTAVPDSPDYGTFSGDTVYYLNDKDNAYIYLRKIAFLGEQRFIALYKDTTTINGTEVIEQFYNLYGPINETINFNGSGLGEGTYYILYYLVGGHSSLSYRKMYKIIVDHTYPIAGTMTMKRGGSSGITYLNDTWTNQSVYISLKGGSDGFSGHKSTTYSVSGATNLASTNQPAILSGSGTYNITVTTTDKAGNISTRDYIVKIDIVNPTAGTMTMKRGGSSGITYLNDTWTNQSVYISLNNGSDGLSGHKSTTYKVSGATTITNRTAATTLSASGTYNITVTTTDNAGNISYGYYTVKIDKGKPTAGTMTMKLGSSSGNPYSNDSFTNQNVYISLNNGSDDLSGHNSTTYSVSGATNLASRTDATTLSGSGTYNITVTTTDKAGNISTRDYTVKIDKVNPTVSFSPSSDDTHSKNKTVLITGNDNNGLDHSYLKYKWSTSNIFSSTSMTSSALTQTNDKIGYLSVDSPLGLNGEYYLHVQIKDEAGNTKNAVAGPFRLDNEVPTLSRLELYNELAETNYTQGTWTNDNAVVVFSCSDSKSGMKKCDLYNGSTLLWSFTSGGYHIITSNINSSSIRIRMEDNAGNVSYSSYITIRINKTKPTIVVTPDLLGGANQYIDLSEISQITINATDYGGGMDKIEYKWCSDETNCPASYTPVLNVNSTVISPPNVPEGDVRYLWVQSTDKVGNVSTLKKVGPYYFVHNEGPDITFTEPSPYINTSKGFRLDVMITPTNGLIRNFAVPGDEAPTGTVYTKITINGPNYMVIEINNKQGGCDAFLAMTDNYGWCDFGTPNVSDIDSYVHVTSYHQTMLNTLTLTDNGRYTVNISAAQVDNYNNLTYSSKSFTFFLDFKKPNTPGNPVPTANNWVDGTGSRHISYSCTGDNDGGSGLKSCGLYNGSTLIHEGVTNGQNYAMFTKYYSNLKVRAIDMAGNYKDSDLGVKVKIDAVTPTANLTVSRNTWTNQDVTITPSCIDSHSGIASCNVSINGNLTTDTSISAEGVYDVQTIAVDEVGNINSSDTITVKIDKTVKSVQFDKSAIDKLAFSVSSLESYKSPLKTMQIYINGVLLSNVTKPTNQNNIDYATFNFYGIYNISINTEDTAGNTGTFTHKIKYENPGFSLDEITVGYGSGSATHTTGLQRGDGNTYFAAIRNDGSNPSKIISTSTSSLYNQFFGADAFSTNVKYKINSDETLISLTNDQISIPAIVSGSGSCIAADYVTCGRVDTITLVVEASGIPVMQRILIISLDIRPTNTSAGSGTQSVNVNVGQEYNVEPVTFNSQIGNEIVSVEETIEFNGEVVDSIDTNKIGTYTITTIATDSEGFKSLPVVRTIVVKDTIPPTISLIGDQTITIKKGGKYIDQGSLAIDNVDGELTVYGSGEVNYNKTGIYEITYQYIDSNGNVSEVITRTVIVKPDYAKYAILALSSITVLGIAFILIKKFNVKTSY